MTLHPQAQRLEPLDEQERVERRDRRPDVALVLEPCLQDVLRGTQRLGQLREDQPVVRRIGFGEVGEPATRDVVELPAVDDDAADRRAVSADELRRRVHDDVGAMAQRLAEVWRADGVVDDERDLVVVRDLAHALEVEHVALRVADRLAVERARLGPDRGGPGLEVVGIVDERDLNAELGQRVVEQVVGAAVERRRRHDVPTVLGQVEQRDRLGGLPARGGERADSAVERGHPLFEHRLRRVHDPRVDHPELFETEQRGRVRGVAEHVARRLEDRDGAGPGRRVGDRSCMHLARLEAPIGHDTLLGWLHPSGAIGWRVRVQTRVIK